MSFARSLASLVCSFVPSLAATVALLLAAPAAMAQESGAPKAPPAGRLAPTIANAKLAEEELATLAEHDDEWLSEEKLACRSSQAKKLWEGTLIDAALGKPARQEFQTIGVGLESDSLLYFEFDGPVPEAWRKSLHEKLWSASGEPSFTQPELVGTAGSLVVVLSCSLTSKIRQQVGHRLRTRFGMRFSDRDADHRKLTDPLVTALQEAARAKGKPAASAFDHLAKHAVELAPLSLAAFLEARLHSANESHELAVKAYERALALDAAGDPLPSDFTVCDAYDGIAQAAYDTKRWPAAIAAFQSAADFAGTLGFASRQSASLYNLACSAALGGEAETAMTALRECFALSGRRFQSQARQDKDLESLRERDDWKALVK